MKPVIKIKGGEYKYMEERHLLLEKTVETVKKPQEAVAPAQPVKVDEPAPAMPKREIKNAFSSKTFPVQAELAEPEVEKEPLREEKVEQSDSVIEKPNYDFIEELTLEEEKKVYKVERGEEKPKPKLFSKRLRLALFSLVSMVCLIWGIVNVVEITNLQDQINMATQEYQLNLGNYLMKLGTLDTASSYNELFETTPAELVPPSSISHSSNWFDRICNFIAGLFGG